MASGSLARARTSLDAAGEENTLTAFELTPVCVTCAIRVSRGGWIIMFVVYGTVGNGSSDH